MKRFHLSKSDLWLEFDQEHLIHVFKVYAKEKDFMPILSGVKIKGEPLSIHKKTMGATDKIITAVDKALDYILESK